jgi:hypothetical protein
MIGLVVICVISNWNQPVKKELLRIGIILGFEGLGVVIRYCVWSVWGRSFMGGWARGRGRNLGSMWGGGMSRFIFGELSEYLVFQLEFVPV